MTTIPTIAYFSMEIGLEPEMPTYSGGLGILARHDSFSRGSQSSMVCRHPALPEGLLLPET